MDWMVCREFKVCGQMVMKVYMNIYSCFVNVFVYDIGGSQAIDFICICV